MNIISVFSGRKSNIELLSKYLKNALEMKIIDEVHFWNNTRNKDDEDYLKTISNLKRTSSALNSEYILITPLIKENTFDLFVKASNDIHIKISDTETDYEIVLGGWNNTKSVIRENNIEMYHLIKTGIADGMVENNFKIVVLDDILHIIKNGLLLISVTIKKKFDIKNIYFKTGFGAVGELKYNTIQNKGFYFMDTCEKSWNNYYNYYNNNKFVEDIIIKCDDDIVFIDLYKLPKFIEFVKNNDYDLVLANTINNGVAAYFQQQKYNLIPEELMSLEYPNNGLCGTLWESGKKAEKLHNYFIENYNKFLNYEYNNEIIPITTRFSINFFGYKGKNWHKIIDSNSGNDEYNLTVEYVKNRGFKNIMYSDFYVSHLSFYRQNETGIDLENLIDKYNKLYYTVEDSCRFT
jgi:hypothetical protein